MSSRTQLAGWLASNWAASNWLTGGVLYALAHGSSPQYWLLPAK